MATKKKRSGIEDEGGRTNSSQACLLLEVASILSLATEDTHQLGQCLGIPNSQVVEINASLEDPKNKILHLLERFRDRHGNVDWQKKLEEAVRDTLKNDALAKDIGNVQKTKLQTPSESVKQPKASTTPASKDTPVTSYQSQPSTGHSSEWEITGGSDHETDHSSTSYERLSEEGYFDLREGKSEGKVQDQHHASLDQPEMSMQIAKVGEALSVVSDLLGNMEGINQLSEVIPQILQLVRQMKSQKMLRLVFEEENANLKQDLSKANVTIQELREIIVKLESELLDLKKKEDKSLKDFDYVTKKEADEMKEQQKQNEDKNQSSAPQAASQPIPSEGVSQETYETLQKKIITLKQKLAQVVKLNHSWDDQYHRMESALKQEHEKVKQQMADQTVEWEKREKEREEVLRSAKKALEGAQAEKTSLQIAIDRANQQVTKVTRYAQSLQEHKRELEQEVKRLNEALEQKLQVKEKAPTHVAMSGKPASKPASRPIPREKGREELVSHDERSLLESMSQDALIEELGILKQQVDIYRSDFYKEQRDRQRAMGELDEVKTELYRTQKRMEKQKSDLQIVQDQALAYKYQAKQQTPSQPAAAAKSKPVKKPQQTASAYYGYHAPRPVQQHHKHRRPSDRDRDLDDELVPHGGAVNYAMNDIYIDGMEPDKVYYPPEDPDSRSYMDY